MKKSDKKLDNQIRTELTELCDFATETCEGFTWLTHLVDYSRFPSSLKIVFVFDTNTNLVSFSDSTAEQELMRQLAKQLSFINITPKALLSHVRYDTEEACSNEHQGKWAKRLS